MSTKIGKMEKQNGNYGKDNGDFFACSKTEMDQKFSHYSMWACLDPFWVLNRLYDGPTI